MAFHSQRIQPATLDRDVEPCCVLDSSYRILYCNQAWDDFARANGGSAGTCGSALEGRCLTSFIPGPLRAFYADHLRSAMWGGMWSHVYECSSPTEFRLYRLQALALPDTRELLTCHTCLSLTPHARIPVKPDPGAHSPNGVVTLCSHCRRTKRAGADSWDWIPEFLARPPENRADDLCPGCEAYYNRGVTPWGRPEF
jgi:hypothetical protein